MVAASFDRSMFSCRACEDEERRGGDLRVQNSGAPRSCDGPREWAFFRQHPAGGISWRGCPRRSSTLRTEAWLAAYDRCGGKLSYTEQRRAPMLLLDVFSALDHVRALQAWDAHRQATSGANASRGAR